MRWVTKWMLSYLINRYSLIWIKFENLRQQILHNHWHMLRFFIHSLFYLVINNLRTLVLEGKKSTYHRIKYNTTAPDISKKRIISLLNQHFRRSIARTTTGSKQFLCLLIEITQSEVNELDIILVIKQDIFRFNITVCDSNRMQILYSIDKLLENGRSSWLRKPTPKFIIPLLFILGYHIEELPVFCILHHNVNIVVRFKCL